MMSRKKNQNIDIVDTHAHILPGIDDGAKTLEMSVEIVRWLAEQGVTDIIATPHYIMETKYNSLKSANTKLLKKLKAKLKAENINVKLYLGNEIYVNGEIKKLIKAKKVAPINDGEYLLVEMPLDADYLEYEDYFRDLIEDGYKVILAHPERYSAIQKNIKIAQRLYGMGVLFQCNAGSILKKYGKRAKKVVKKLAKNKMIFVLGSDAHRPGRKKYLLKAQKKLKRFYNDEELKQLLEVNPKLVLKKKTKKKAAKKKVITKKKTTTKKTNTKKTSKK